MLVDADVVVFPELVTTLMEQSRHLKAKLVVQFFRARIGQHDQSVGPVNLLDFLKFVDEGGVNPASNSLPDPVRAQVDAGHYGRAVGGALVEPKAGRIDFVYFKGKGLQVKDVKILGENKANADLVVTPYPSDHRAVVASFKLSF